MAITIQNTFNDVVAIQEPLVLSATSDKTAEEKFRYCLTLDINSVEVITIKLTKNANNWAHFDLSKIIRDYFEKIQLEGTTPIHNVLGAAPGENTCLFCEINVFEEYASSATTNPVEYDTSGNATTSFIAINKTSQFTDGVVPVLAGVVEYNDDNTELSALTNMPLIQDMRAGQYQTLPILISDFRGSTYSVDSNAIRVRYVFYDSAGNIVVQANVTKNTIGLDNFITTQSTNNARDLYQFIPVGYQNLEDQSFNTNIKPSNVGDFAYYTVELFDNTNVGNGYQTKTYRFNMKTDCKYTPVRLVFLNAWYAWDYFTFELVSVSSLNINRSTINKPYGNWGAGAIYSYNQYEAGEEVVNIEADNEIVINSNWLDDEYFRWLQELVMSKAVYMVNSNGDYAPVIITDTQYEFKKQVNKHLNNITLKIKLANKIR